ncbi:MAG: phenylacetate--CoA ligase family protein, partial [Rhodobacteraceae bacterium]|nr:phenylacetate--CoA ligase family protein [Paracoccaceae bacterium]
MDFFDTLETRSMDERSAALAEALPAQIARAQAVPGASEALRAVEAASVQTAGDLAALPVLRKSDLVAAQSANPPFGGLISGPVHHIFQSPGPIYEPGQTSTDWWRVGRFLHAVGVGPSDVVQNCFAYHFTPAGMIFESGAAAVGATVIPAGTGQTDLQVRAAADCGTTAYAGTPDYLKVILERADEQGVALAITKAAVGGGPLFPQLRQYYADRGI